MDASPNPDSPASSGNEYQPEPDPGTRTPPQGSTAPDVDATPAVRPPPGSKASQSIRLKLEGQAPDGKRCLITREEYPNIEKCHLMPDALKSKGPVLTRLEYWFGLEHGSLSVDSTSNMLWLRSDLHHAFDQGDWFFLPTLEVLQSIFNYYSRLKKSRPNPFTEQWPHKGSWEYTVHVVPGQWKPILIFRREYPTHPMTDLLDHFTVHQHPYTDFPIIQSHVHPFYVIQNAASKAPRALLSATPEQKERITLLSYIVSIWQGEPPVAWLGTSGSQPGQGDRNDGDEGGGGPSGSAVSTRSSTRRRREEETPPGADDAGQPSGLAGKMQKRRYAHPARRFPSASSASSLSSESDPRPNPQIGDPLLTKSWVTTEDWTRNILDGAGQEEADPLQRDALLLSVLENYQDEKPREPTTDQAQLNEQYRRSM
ncbi:hypothetical protein FRB99_005956 [Tulasnella sp. 403]|nr:hypothetical protein FRB99_005956 [Tulasnella sp. 403]